jgi:predicted  nucleic acid-binding Zn-ribbon protein
VRRQNLGALIVIAAVVLSLIVAVFIVPMIQPRGTGERAKLDEAAERAARRLNVLQRMTDQAVTADRANLVLPENVLKPDAEAVQRSLANNLAMINESAGKVSSRFKQILADNDKRYESITGDKFSEGDRAEAIEVPAGESAQVNWIRQLQAKGQDPSAALLKDLGNAISELQQSIGAVSLDDYRGTDHFRTNWVLGGLQYQKAVLLTNLAANHRAKADSIRTRLVDDYRRYTTATAQVKALESRLAAISPAAPRAQAAPVRKVTAPGDPLQAAVEAAGPTPVTPTDDADAPAADQTAQADQAPPAPMSATALPATEDPSVLAAQYEQEIDGQIAATEKKIVELQQTIAEPQQQLDQTNQHLQDFQQKLAQVEQAGYDVTSIESFETYQKAFSDLSAQIRAAEAAAQALQEGTLAGAQIDPDSGDDLTKVVYTGGEPQVGLTTLNRRLAGLQRTLDLLKGSRQEMQTMRASLQQQKLSQETALEQAHVTAKERADQLAKTYAELDAELTAADTGETEAYDLCRNVAQAYTTALQAAKKQSADASNELSIANPAPDKRNERLEQLRDYDSPQAASEHGLFNAYMLMAQIQLQRAVSLQSYYSLAQSIQSAGVPTRAAEMDKTIQESLDAAIGALHGPESQSDAVRHADAYTRLISKEKFAWLGPASRGLAFNALAQAETVKGQAEKAADARKEAVTALSEAVKGAENSELLQPYTHLLASLRKAEQ